MQNDELCEFLREALTTCDAQEAIMKAQVSSKATSAKIRALCKTTRQPSSKDAWHFDPMEGRRMSDDEEGWLIGAVIVVSICAVMVIVSTADYWGF